MYEPCQCDAMHEIVGVDALSILTISQFAFFYIIFLYMLMRDIRLFWRQRTFLARTSAADCSRLRLPIFAPQTSCRNLASFSLGGMNSESRGLYNLVLSSSRGTFDAGRNGTLKCVWTSHFCYRVAKTLWIDTPERMYFSDLQRGG